MRWVQLGGGSGACSWLTPEVAHLTPSLKLSAMMPGQKCGWTAGHRADLQGSWSFEQTQGPPSGGVGLPQETPGCPKRLSGLGVSKGSSRGGKDAVLAIDDLSG